MTISLKRVYETPAEQDGYRILVDRLWPRGLSKESAMVDMWLRDIAPSTELRKWFHHEEGKWEEFEKRYRQELVHHGDLLGSIREAEKREGVITLVYGAKDEQHNQAVVILDVLNGR
jgi:DNA-3-methyladenine glycosylase